MGAAPRDLDRVAALRARLAGQARGGQLGRTPRSRASCRATSRWKSSAHSDAVAATRARVPGRARRARRSRPPAPRADRPRVAARQRADGGLRRCWRPRRSSTGRSTAGPSTTTGGSTRGVGPAVAAITGLRRLEPPRSDGAGRLVLEGGGIEPNGDGLLLVTEEWLLSGCPGQEPRPHARRLRTRLRRVARHPPHDLARRRLRRRRHARPRRRRGAVRVARTRSCSPCEDDPADENHARSLDNLRRLERAASDSAIGPLRVVRLPFPRPLFASAERLPASYANFYVANGVVLVPTFNDPNDRVALETLAGLFPERDVIGIHAVDLVWGQGSCTASPSRSRSRSDSNRGSSEVLLQSCRERPVPRIAIDRHRARSIGELRAAPGRQAAFAQSIRRPTG